MILLCMATRIATDEFRRLSIVEKDPPIGLKDIFWTTLAKMSPPWGFAAAR